MFIFSFIVFSFTLIQSFIFILNIEDLKNCTRHAYLSRGWQGFKVFTPSELRNRTWKGYSKVQMSMFKNWQLNCRLQKEHLIMKYIFSFPEIWKQFMLYNNLKTHLLSKSKTLQCHVLSQESVRVLELHLDISRIYFCS